MFPELGAAGGTKRHLVEYFRAMATAEVPPGGDGEAVPPLLRALRNRPTYLQRFPDGISGDDIYQKRLPAKGVPDYVPSCQVTFPSGRKADALLVRAAPEIVWAGQMGCVTFHPLHTRCADTDHPDEFRIDLDPQPGTGFKEARELAGEVIRPLLEELGYTAFPKTSGGRGVHVYVRIQPRWSFLEVRRAVIALAREAERRAGGRLTTAWWKEERGTAVFIDFNQNARDRTIASAYSVRKTPRATVSAPLTWAELADADPDDLTIATVPGLVAQRGDPMAALDDVAHDLSAALELATRDEADGLPGMPYPPNYPKMPDEPKRVRPSRARADTEGMAPATGQGLPDLD
jgi:DNA ligase D-like protein (predicted polymerase)